MRIKGIMALMLGVAMIAQGQGPLTPPGAPAPGMKTLDQVEARTPISEPVTLERSGSYYLVTNIVSIGSTAAIIVNTNDVHIDLNGFAILGAGGTGNGIYIETGVNNCVVENGTVRGCYYHGIYAYYATNCSFVDLTMVNNSRVSTSYDGIKTGAKARVERCHILDNGGDGLDVRGESRIVNNTITGNGYVGLRMDETMSYVNDNIVRANADNYRLVAGNQLNLLLCEIPETLDWPCSVKLAGTLTCSITGTNGITVNADNVTIDLAGHTLVGPGALSGCGVYQDYGRMNLALYNGKAVGWRGQGQYQAGFCTRGNGNHLSGLQAATNYIGIYAGSGNSISDCMVVNNDNVGLYAADGNALSHCVALSNRLHGIYVDNGNTLRECAAKYNFNDGIYANNGNTISDCVMQDNGDDGLVVDFGNTIRDCASQSNTRHGANIYADNRVVGNAFDSNGDGGDGSGLVVIAGDNRIEGNSCTDNDRGFDVNASGNFIARNTCSGNATNWDIMAGNVCLVVSGMTSGAISGNVGGTAPGSTDPNANFTF